MLRKPLCDFNGPRAGAFYTNPSFFQSQIIADLKKYYIVAVHFKIKENMGFIWCIKHYFNFYFIFVFGGR